jgi:hypothetical protein
MRHLLASLVILLAFNAPAQAQQWVETPPTSLMEKAAVAVRIYLASVPNLPPDILVIPAAGDISWPGSAPGDNVRAEVWMVVPRDNPKARPLMMFAVRPGTGEVYGMFLTNLQKTPTYK